MKTCTKCKVEKSKDCFHKAASRKSGLHPWCKSCISLCNKADYARNQAYRSQKKKAYNKTNREKLNAYERYYYKEMKPGKGAAKTAAYHAAKLKATPPWLSEAHYELMEQIYANCPDGYEVDHIIPLRGDGVSGLHLPWNLQYLTVSDNRSKNNRT